MKRFIVRNRILRARWILFATLIAMLVVLCWPTLYAYLFYGLFGLNSQRQYRQIPDNYTALILDFFWLFAAYYMSVKFRLRTEWNPKTALWMLFLIAVILSSNSVMWSPDLIQQSGLNWLAGDALVSSWMINFGTLTMATGALLIAPA